EHALPWRCPCGGPLACEPAAFNYAPEPLLPGLWRYASSLPVADPKKALHLGEGMTPLVPVNWDYGAGKAEILCKMDTLNPSGSYKDRGAAVALSRLRELGLTKLVEDSSGNAGAAVAAYAAAAGIACDIFVPASASEGKCVQIAAYGARLRRIPGPREAAAAAAEAAAQSDYYAGHNWNPYFPEGVKTYAFEIFEQLGDQAPDNIIVPAGQGSLVSGAWKAFSEIAAAGKSARMPRIFGIQSAHCAPLHQAWKNGDAAIRPFEKKPTIAEGIASAFPVRPSTVLQAARGSKGAFAAVKEAEIWAAFEKLARAGIYVEPTSATALAGLSRLWEEGAIRPGECTVALLSGIGLKATDKILELRARPESL
ncbi:MAG: pyridoxal-phosphate dependent enzyme, partial [Desulfovibrionaceae bacterium]|nr:pyridoxal-phosphate dependent enzyme [Desulfovibrionaceae bacterium]